MRLKTIKEKTGDTHYAKYVFKEIDLIKEKLSIPEKDLMFFIGYFYFGQVFLYDAKIYVANIEMEYTKNRESLVDTMVLSELYEIRTDNYEIKIIIKSENFNKDDFIQNIFIPWLEQPCDLNYEIDNQYGEIINYLNSYTKETFKTNRYLFYSKRDNDYNFINNIYAYDLRNQTEMKLYIPDKWKVENGKWKVSIPQLVKEVTIDDLGQDISNYRKRECKKAFLELANRENSYFKVKNYWVMELIKLVVQPVLILHEWSCHRCFCKPDLFGHIWVYDFPDKNEEPSFFITDKHFTKVAVLKFKSAEYLFKGIYKRNLAKAKGWELNEQEKKELIEFFNKPSGRADEYGNSSLYKGYKKYVKTNWQQLIFEYNHNTAGWGWSEDNFDTPPEKDTDRLSDVEALSFDLPLPNYRELR